MSAMSNCLAAGFAALLGATALMTSTASANAQEKRPNIVMLMTDDTGWNDFGARGGGANLGHPTPNIDRVARKVPVHELVWPGELHRRPRLVHDRALPDPFGPFSGGRAWP